MPGEPRPHPVASTLPFLVFDFPLRLFILTKEICLKFQQKERKDVEEVNQETGRDPGPRPPTPCMNPVTQGAKAGTDGSSIS